MEYIPRVNKVSNKIVNVKDVWQSSQRSVIIVDNKKAAKSSLLIIYFGN